LVVSPEYPACAEHRSFIAHRSWIVAREEPADYGDLLAAGRHGVTVLIEKLERVKPCGVLAGQHQRGAAPVVVNQPDGDAITVGFADQHPTERRETSGSVQKANRTRRR
jgi:hypothetical protein